MSRVKAFALGMLLGFGAVTAWSIWLGWGPVSVKVYDSEDDAPKPPTPVDQLVKCH